MKRLGTSLLGIALLLIMFAGLRQARLQNGESGDELLPVAEAKRLPDPPSPQVKAIHRPSKSSHPINPAFNTANVWSIPKPPVTNYTALVQIQCDAAAFQAKGGQGYTDMEVAYHFPICVKADGTTNHEYIKMFRYFLDEQSKWNLAEMARPKDPAVHKEMARPVEREPIDDGRALQYQIMIKEGRTIPPIPTQFELSQDFLDIGDGRYRSMSVEGVRFHLVQAQVEYLLNDTPGKALEGLRFLKADISDEQASFLLRTPTDQLVPATAYAEYVLPKK